MLRERVMMRGLPLVVLMLAGCDSSTDGDSEAGSLIPNAATVYDVRIMGATYSGSTNFPGSQTTYFQVASFDLTGVLIVDQTQDRSGANFQNGTNARDVAILVGSPPAAPAAGSIWLATNTTLYQRAGIGNVALGLASINVAFVTMNASTGLLSIRLDGSFNGLPAARTSLLNTFNMRSGQLANVYQALDGGLDLQFSNEGRSIQGAIDVVGNGMIEPGSARLQANLAAVRR